MNISIPCSLQQELLIEEHLLNNKQLFIAPNERKYLVDFVKKNHNGYKIITAEIDLENVTWRLEIEKVTN